MPDIDGNDEFIHLQCALTILELHPRAHTYNLPLLSHPKKKDQRPDVVTAVDKAKTLAGVSTIVF